MFGNFSLGVPFSRTTHACRQDGRNVMCSDAVWEKENLSDRFLLICSRPWVFSVFPLMKSSSADLIRDSFQFVPQAFFWYSHIAFFSTTVCFSHEQYITQWQIHEKFPPAVLCYAAAFCFPGWRTSLCQLSPVPWHWDGDFGGSGTLLTAVQPAKSEKFQLIGTKCLQVASKSISYRVKVRN